MIPAAIDKAIAEGLAASVPESDLSCSEWTGKYRHVSPDRSARPGLWDNAVVPFLVEIMDAMSDPRVRRVVLQKSSQVAGSEAIVNYVCYRIATSPTMIIYCAESEDKAKAWAYESFDTTVEVTPVIKQRVKALKGSEDNNQKRKKFAGGLLSIVYASSAAQLSSRPAEVILVDEADACVENAEGSPIGLLEARTKTFDSTKKVILVSSPRNKETSVIEPEYLDSDMRSFYVPCPHCGEYQTLKWANVRWEDEPLDAYYVCDISGCVIENYEKQQMLIDGYWQAEKEFRGTAGFKISEIYSPFTTWGTMANAFLKAKKSKTPAAMQTFVNTSLGETWENDGEKIEYADLTFLKEDYDAEVPDGVLLLTAAVDVQGDRLEAEVLGWGMDGENWSIAYKVFLGSPSEKAVWDELKNYLSRDFEGTETMFKVKAVCVDSGGHHTQEVYKFCRANAGRRFWAVKGLSTPSNPIAPKKYSIVGKAKYRLYGIGTEAAKDMIFAQLKKQIDPDEDQGEEIETSGEGYCHFPSDRDPDYFKQLCAEKKVTTFVRGKATQFWAKVSANARNEALDLRVYNIAAFHILNPDLLSYQSALEKKRAAAAARANEESIEPRKNKEVENAKVENRKPAAPPRRRGFVSGAGGKGFVGNY